MEAIAIGLFIMAGMGIIMGFFIGLTIWLEKVFLNK